MGCWELKEVEMGGSEVSGDYRSVLRMGRQGPAQGGERGVWASQDLAREGKNFAKENQVAGGVVGWGTRLNVGGTTGWLQC